MRDTTDKTRRDETPQMQRNGRNTTGRNSTDKAQQTKRDEDKTQQTKRSADEKPLRVPAKLFTFRGDTSVATGKTAGL